MSPIIRFLLGSTLLCCIGDVRATLIADPGQAVFPPVLVGEVSEPLSVTLTNTGNQSLNVVGLTPVFNEFARVGGSCGEVPFALAAQANCTLEYTFTPQFFGTLTQVVRATPDFGNFVEFTLIGSGVVDFLRIEPGQLMFPLQAVGTTAGPLFVTVKNISRTPATVVSLTPATGEYAYAGGSCGTVPFDIAGLGSCTLGYTFTPFGVGMVYQTLTATASAGNPVNFGLAGEGDQGRLVVQPRYIYFIPAIPVGAISEERVATLQNIGRVPMDVLEIGPAVEPPTISFVLSGGTCPTPPFSLAASDTCTVLFTFVPSAEGEVELDVRFKNSVSSPETVTLRGEGLPGSDTLFADGFEGLDGI